MNILVLRDLQKEFRIRQSLWQNFIKKENLKFVAVDRINLQVAEGRTLGLVGESGSGKTVTGEMIARLQKPNSGTIKFMGNDIQTLRGKELLQFRRQLQMIFQDPFESLNPKFNVQQTLLEPLLIHRLSHNPGKQEELVRQALEQVGLTPVANYLYRYPHQLSGGERQRVAIGRALILKPRFIVADEPTSMLDVSVRAGILNLFMNLRKQARLSMLYISHDFSTVRYLCDEIAVMYLGKIVEAGPARKVIHQAQHPYTRLLIESIPKVQGRQKSREQEDAETNVGIAIKPEDRRKGCRFRFRCPLAAPVCNEIDPELLPVADDHHVACHVVQQWNTSGSGDEVV